MEIKKPHAGNRSRIKKLLVLFTLFFILIIAVVIGFAMYLLNSSRSTPPTLNENDLEIIASFIKFSDADTTNYVYESPLYDFGVEIDTTKYKYAETSQGLSLSNDDYSELVTLLVNENTDNITINTAVENYEDQNQYLKSFKIDSSKSITIDNLPAVQINSSYQSYNGENINVVTAITINEKYIYEIQYTNIAGSTPVIALFNNIVSKFKFIDSSKTSDVAIYESSLWGYSFSYNSKFWLLNRSDYTAALSRRVYPNEIANDISIDLSSREILRSELTGKESRFLKSEFDKRVGEITTSTVYKYTVTNTGDIEIAGRKAKFVDYTNENGSEYLPRYTREIMILHYNTLTTISINYGSDEILSEIDTVLASFKIAEPSKGVVKGIDNVQLDEKAAMLTKPAVVQILFQRCGLLYLPKEADYPNTTGKSYDLCSAGTGSGFFISSDGYVATNGHVVSISDATYKETAYNLTLLYNLFRDFYLPELQKFDPVLYKSMTDAQILSLIKSKPTIAYDLLGISSKLLSNVFSKIKITDTAYVQKGSNAFDLSGNTSKLVNTSEHLKAEIVAIDYDANVTDDKTEQASDVAILKVMDGDYPVLRLGNNEFTISGTEIIAVGFPGIADQLSFIDTDIESQETFTKGVISRIVSTTGDRKILQIDASINHGNSGGPVISIGTVTVLGLATYGVESGGSSDFNYARDVADLKKLMDANNVTNKVGLTSESLEAGINFFFDGKYSKAVTALESAIETYPDVEGLDKIIALAKDKIAQGLDVKEEEPKKEDLLTYINDLSNTEKGLFGVVGCLICVVMLLGLGTLIVFMRTRRQKTVAYQVPIQNPVPNAGVPVK